MSINRKPATTVEATDGVSWQSADELKVRRSAFVQAYGESGSGRTTLALTAPGPIALIHASEKIEGIVQRVATEKEVRLYDFGGVFRGTDQQIADAASRVWDGVSAAIEDAWGWARTIVLDTHSELWELIRLARFGKLSQVMPHHYGPVNAEWRTMFKQFRHQERTNLVAIGQIRERYRNDKPTGIMEQAGHKEMPYYADVIVRTGRTKKGDFTGTVEKGWFEASVEGLELDGDMLTFASMLQVITGQDWSAGC